MVFFYRSMLHMKPTFLLFLLFVIPLQLRAGSTFCESVQSGSWTSPATWINCNGQYPNATSHEALIKTGHVVTLDVSAIVLQKYTMELGSVLSVDHGINPVTIETTTHSFDAQQGQIQLFGGDFTIEANSNNINLGLVDGDAHLILNSTGSTLITNAIGSAIPVKSITSDAAGYLRTTGSQFTIRVNGTTDTVINDIYQVGASSRATWEQLGGADLVFNNEITQHSGSPHQVTVALTGGGDVWFNAHVQLGDLTINGSGNTFINADITTNSGGANLGYMTFNVPVIVMSDATFSAVNAGSKVMFNDRLDDDGDQLTSSNITITGASELVLNAVGQQAPLASLSVQNVNSTLLYDAVTTIGNQNWAVDITQANPVVFTSTNSDIQFNATLNAAGHDTTINKGSGIFILNALNIIQPNTLTIGPSGFTDLTGDFTFAGNLQVLNSIRLLATSTLSVIDLQANYIYLEGNVLTLEVSSETSTINQPIDGAPFNSGQPDNSAFIKTGTGTLTVNGITSAEPTQVLAGRLNTNGPHNQETYVYGNATLGGFSDSIPYAAINDNATLDPGDEHSVGLMTFDTLFFNTNTTHTSIDINGPLSTEHDQIKVLGPNVIDGHLDLRGDYVPVTGDTFTIIDNQAFFAILGTFVGLPEGASPALGLEITYQGGDGNDVVLTAVCDTQVTVTDGGDSGPGTLKDVMVNLCDGGVVQFDQAVNEVLLDSPITVDKTITINGDGTIINGTDISQVFEITQNGDLTLNQLRVESGNSAWGAIRNLGNLTVNQVYFGNNFSTGGGGLGGGAIINQGMADISQSVFYRNNASRGGALFNADGATLTVTNSTFFENGVFNSAEGGVIHNRGNATFINTTMVNSGDGDVPFGNTIANYGINASMSLINSVIDSESLQTECQEPSDTIMTVINSFIHDGSCGATFSGDPQLGQWGSSVRGFVGDVSYVIPPLDNSPLINTGSNAECPAIDQLGTSRPLGIACDIGAVEVNDSTDPSVDLVAVNEQLINSCEHLPDGLISTLSVTYSEPVLNAENSNHYSLIHAGDDFTFDSMIGGGDDLVYTASAVLSDQNNPPTISLNIDAGLEAGLVRLFVAPDITDTFGNPLNNGNDFFYQFRIDPNNLLRNGHFDDCGQSSVITGGWTYESVQNPGNPGDTGMPTGFEDGILDRDASPHSQSLKILTDDSNTEYIMSQCINLVSDLLPLELSATVFTSLTQATETSEVMQRGGPTASIDLYCQQWNLVDCMGDPMAIHSQVFTGLSPALTGEDIKATLGVPDDTAMSAVCGIRSTVNENNALHVLIDGVRLEQPDLIFKNGLE